MKFFAFFASLRCKLILVGENMAEKVHIKTKATPPRFAPVGKFGIIEAAENCLGCLHCKKRSCIYDIYRKEASYLREASEASDFADMLYACMNCLRCVQECAGGILTRVVNPEYLRLGDAYWTPDIIATTWAQADTGKIPVSGAGYLGPFSGPGFDTMWTDMSEIVRPTRDGIHGREYISTAVDIGRKLGALKFDADGALVGETPPLLDIAMPIMFDVLPFGRISDGVRKAMARAASELGVLMILEPEHYFDGLSEYAKHLVPLLSTASFERDLERIPNVRMVELELADGVMDRVKQVKDRLKEVIVAIRVPLDRDAEAVVERLASDGAEVIHLCADVHGNELDGANPRFIKDCVRAIHLRLIETAFRDQVTLIASGGIALAEHVAKVIVCGADLTAIDLPILLALECRLCRNCEQNLPCPVELEHVDETYAQQRIVNLMGAWHSQLIEVMGAMGIREVRRLRGETGRAMFFEDMEAESFGPLFGQRIEGESGRGGERERETSIGWEKESPPHPLTPSPPPGNGVEVRPAPPRFKNPIGKYKVRRNTALCVHCGHCAEVCAYGVHERREGFSRMSRPVEYKCIGFSCSECVDQCPQHALSLEINPLYETLGDARWTADLLLSTWAQAETGQLPDGDMETRIGASGGGFDRMRFRFPEENSGIGDQGSGSRGDPCDRPLSSGSSASLRLRSGQALRCNAESVEDEAISTSIDLNKRGDDRPEFTIDLPIYGGGMSFGSVSLSVIEAKARVAKAFHTFTCTGEGGYPQVLTPYADHVITQVATGLFGVREETIQRARIVEFKYAQGAKPGLGGHLLGDKNTPDVARMREAVMGSALFSPFPFHSVYSVEDHKKHLDWIKAVNPKALVSVKVSTPTDVEMVAVGSYYAGAHIIHLDGSYGGTGAAPDIAKKNIAMPIEYAIPKVHGFLEAEGIRDKVTLIASGGLRTAYDVAKAIALGADGVVIGTAELVALGCIRCTNCESGRGCARGIATTDPELSKMIDVEWGTQRLINLYASWQSQLRDILRRLGMRSIRELRGRSDCLVHLDYENASTPAAVT
ncbi:MAG: hypothetical protein DRP97_04715 [Candidatus Latescibacterota bacterium]|nr:MAG: hypothetical protein DRP97_04715 [Candidatus Latescibacterota bacterium]